MPEGLAVRNYFDLKESPRTAWVGIALIAVADTLGHPGVGVLLESCLADKLAFMERTRSLIREQIAEQFSHA